ncbi:NAD(P)H-binding protein [Mangrovibacter phragmitis]|uniref:NAD(P)H-binding protein n=1 Tax=Mangrovibacter phragmitis TaxID=1691903 RepID=UPI00336A7821
MNVLLAGASGLVGSHLLELLVASPHISHIVIAARRSLPSHPKVTCIAAPELADALNQVATPVDLVFCCLGTTRHDAGSTQAFYAVDHDLVVLTGKTGLRLGAEKMLVVSAMGANPRSCIFYNRTKGLAEYALIEQAWPELVIARPSMLLGSRRKKRWTETLSTPFFKCLPGSLRAIRAADVARALMFNALSDNKSAVVVRDSAQLSQDAKHYTV